MTDIVYPNGCRPLVEDLGTDELIRRLKTLANVLQTMDQDDNLYQQYIPLALHLLDDFFMQHTSRDVQLLIACCIADVMRVYAPEAPYKEQDQIKSIFKFFIKQLHGLKDPRDPSFKRYFYLLENLAFVKSFNMCFELEDCQEIFHDLFSTIFKIVNDQHSAKITNFFLDVLSALITEADNLSVDLLDLLLINIVKPNKSSNRCAAHITDQLLAKTGDALESPIKMFFNRALVMDKPNNKLSITNKIYDIIYELNRINPDLLYSVLPQLENKLLSTDDAERLKATTLLSRMFSEKDSQLSQKYQNLLRTFLGRFCDISEAVRVKCVQSSMHFLLNHPHLEPDITEKLRLRNHDLDENVRHEVVMAIVATAKREFSVVIEAPELLEIVRERTLDKKYKIRRDAMNGLAYIYKVAICEPNDLSADAKQRVDWIKNKILHGYYKVGLEDRLLVERLLITSLVPYKLAPEERMKKLYHLLGDLDANATKAFVELQKNQMKTRNTVSDWIKLHHSKEFTPRVLGQLAVKQTTIAKSAPADFRPVRLQWVRMTDIVYPNGCRPLVEDLGTDELIRRLKTLANVLQTMDQDDNLYQQYIPLALHLLDDFFMQHTSRDVQLLIACCIADVLRVYAPEAPYKEQDQIKCIFKFFIKQLHGLKDPRDPSFKRYFYLLENLALVKSFNMCFELEDCQEIFHDLFSTIFKIVNDQHSAKITNFFLDVLSALITEADNLSVDLLDLLLINIVEPNKSSNRCAAHITEQLLAKTGDALESPIKMLYFFMPS
ncbi:sister chromatid cohesion protein PDS5 homolog A-like isoform X2 [Drosophila miranda]|uniref:sister chromatid cohesion protein PDS5 homolog A-like isoform X2 n=2 Tax=Drosophila miranda TaxID=7229 RepID=UPI00143F4040|nr:sister chromatid cohesion protein PDS5 homolog A-like isoform X2 [Drosophila miranda]